MDHIIPVNIGHGVVNVGDLPIPFDIVLNASALVVLITFVYLKISWKESIIAHRDELFDDIQSLLPRKFNEMENSNDENDSLLEDNFEHKNDKYSFAEEITEEETLSLQDKELELIIKALERNNGRRKAAAKELGISERTLYRKIKQYDLEL